MKKFCNLVQFENNNHLIQINDIAHLVHMSVYYGFMINGIVNIRSLLIKFGNLFLNSNLLINQFYSLLNENGRDNKKVVDHRWFSYFLAINDIVDLWSYLCEFIDNQYKNR